MKVLFDYQIFSEQKYGGVSRYFANLHNALKTGTEASSKLGLLFTDNVYVKNNELPGAMFNQFIRKTSRRNKYNKWYSRYLVNQNKFDVFHPTYYHPYFLESLKKPFVLTVHDMIYELFPEYFAKELYRFHKEKLIERADHIIAISDCTKNDLQKFYTIEDSKISVVHHGYKMLNTTGLDNIVINNKYILFVGGRFGYKNFNLFIKAVAPVLSKYSIKLICAGGGVFDFEEMKLINELNISDKVQQIAVADEQLAGLYEHAEAFIFPSLYEGFGLPILESFFNNCPVVMSNTSALPEVGGDAAEYFDPTDEQSIAYAIEQVICNKDKQVELRKKGRERASLFSFDNCLQKTLEVYRALA